MKDRIFKVFMDFDGTISRQDVGEEIFKKYGDNDSVQQVVADLLADKITSRECWIALCNSVGIINCKDLDKLIDSLAIEPTFSDFIEYCSEKNIEINVLSDGFDYYIERIFERERIKGINVYSNKLVITAEGKLIPRFPHYDEKCRSSANCKSNHILNLSSEEDFTVFIGDGNSDKEPVEFVDFIFAKNDLLKYCEKERITYFPFNDFNDVIKKLEELSSRKRLKKRHRAELKRKEAYMIE